MFFGGVRGCGKPWLTQTLARMGAEDWFCEYARKDYFAPILDPKSGRSTRPFSVVGGFRVDPDLCPSGLRS